MSVLATSTMCNVQRGSELNHDSSKLTDYIMEMWAYWIFKQVEFVLPEVGSTGWVCLVWDVTWVHLSSPKEVSQRCSKKVNWLCK